MHYGLRWEPNHAVFLLQQPLCWQHFYITLKCHLHRQYQSTECINLITSFRTESEYNKNKKNLLFSVIEEIESVTFVEKITFCIIHVY